MIHKLRRGFFFAARRGTRSPKGTGFTMGRIWLKMPGFYLFAHFYKRVQNLLFVKGLKRRALRLIKGGKVIGYFAFLHILGTAGPHRINT